MTDTKININNSLEMFYNNFTELVGEIVAGKCEICSDDLQLDNDEICASCADAIELEACESYFAD